MHLSFTYYTCASSRQGDYKPGKPVVLGDFYGHGNSGNSVQPQGKYLTNKIISVQSNVCIPQQGLGLQTNKVW